MVATEEQQNTSGIFYVSCYLNTLAINVQLLSMVGCCVETSPSRHLHGNAAGIHCTVEYQYLNDIFTFGEVCVHLSVIPCSSSGITFSEFLFYRCEVSILV